MIMTDQSRMPSALTLDEGFIREPSLRDWLSLIFDFLRDVLDPLIPGRGSDSDNDAYTS